jgi:hypothetical protein
MSALLAEGDASRLIRFSLAFARRRGLIWRRSFVIGQVAKFEARQLIDMALEEIVCVLSRGAAKLDRRRPRRMFVFLRRGHQIHSRGFAPSPRLSQLDPLGPAPRDFWLSCEVVAGTAVRSHLPWARALVHRCCAA